MPFEIPGGWEWVRFGEISNYGESDSASAEEVGDDAWVLDLEDIEKDTGKVLQRLTKQARPFQGIKRPFNRGQLLYSKLRPYLNKVLIAPEDGFCTTEILPIVLFGGINPSYIRAFLMSEQFLQYTEQCSYGVKMPRLGTYDGKQALIPLPSIKEQEEIVGIINNVIALVSVVEVNQQQFESLAAQAKAKILDLAIRGKLVPQDPNDEPASVLLEHIYEEKERLIAEGKIKRDKKESYVFRSDDNSYYATLPTSWTWARIKDICEPQESKIPEGDLFRYIDINAVDNKQHKVMNPKNIATSKAPSRAAKGVRAGDTLFSMVRPYLQNIALVTDELSDCIASTGFYVCRPIQEIISPEYLYRFLVSDYAINGVNAYMRGDNSPSIRKDEMDNFQVPIPPLAEQQRIVAIIEVMMEQLDAIAVTPE